jgi:hypothetical protein
VVWNEGQHFRTVRGKLDKFSTFGGSEVWIAVEASTSRAFSSPIFCR